MASTASIAEVAALVGDPGRAAMLQALMDGRALTAGELAQVAGITPQTASGHLSQLTASHLVAVQQQGRHRYHKLATPQVAQMLESLMLVAVGTLTPRTGPRDEALRRARTCYDHLAGRLGVALADSMEVQGLVEFQEDAGIITTQGKKFLATLNIVLDAKPKSARAHALPLCRLCLDWSERRPHLSGTLGAALCRHCLDNNWLRRRPSSRALDITPKGQRALREVFKVEVN